jgi:hypothetical protein
VIKTINGRQYLYLQMTYRDGRRVRTLNQYIGPATGGFGAGPSNLPTMPEARSIAANAPATPPIAEREALHAGQFTIPVGEAKSDRKRGRRAKAVPKSLPKDGNFSDPFWDTPRTGEHLRKQAALFYKEYRAIRKQHDAPGIFDRYSATGREESSRLMWLQRHLDWYEHKARSLFDRELVYTERGVLMRRAK